MRAYRDQYASLFRLGRGVVVFAISTDSPEELASWAADEDFPQLFGSDSGAVVGRMYGAFRQRRDGSITDNRTLYIVDVEGRIAHRMAPFREIDPMSYEQLGEALRRIAPAVEDDQAP